MKKLLIILTANIPSILCIIASFTLLFHGMSGWGWFLFAGIILQVSYSFRDKE